MVHASLKAVLCLGLACLAPPAAHADEAQAEPKLSVSMMGAGYRTADLDAALRFWTEGLGMAELTRLDHGELVEVILGFDGRQTPPMILLLARKDGADEEIIVSDKDKLVLSVPDAEAARVRLVDAGYEPTALRVHEASGTKVFFVTDPDGHRREITQPPPMPVQ